VLLATGTDTGGSIRQPAAFCGVVGLKPTYGRCSRWGIVAFASSLDQAGPFTRTVADNALMMTAMASHDAKDSTSTQTPLQDLIGAVGDGVKGMKIGVPKEYVMDGMDSEVVTLWEQGQAWLRDAGAELIDVSLPHTKYALPAYYIIAPAEASSNLARYDGVRYGMRVDAETLDGMYEATRAAGFGEEVQRRIMIGTYVLSAGYYDAYYLKAQKVRRLIKGDFDAAFQTVDALLTPATPSAAFPVGRKIDDPVTNFLNDVFTVPANLAGLPGIAVPGGVTSDGLPLGLQVLGRPFDEASLYRVAGVLEQAAGFTTTPARMAGGAA
jgi:aspartyl-tRNA(Asn)/glutamyl-tRNA(Gln) amidotransferase subunit A